MLLTQLKKIFQVVFSTAETRVHFYLQIVLFCQKNKLHMVNLIVTRRLQRKYGVFISHNTVFDKTLEFKHPVGIVIGDSVEIGTNVTVFQNVTIGRADTSITAYPKIGNNTIIYAGAVIVGDIRVGDNCIIGANAVVTQNVPDNCVAVGCPARILPKKPSVG